MIAFPPFSHAQDCRAPIAFGVLSVMIPPPGMEAVQNPSSMYFLSRGADWRTVAEHFADGDSTGDGSKPVLVKDTCEHPKTAKQVEVINVDRSLIISSLPWAGLLPDSHKTTHFRTRPQAKTGVA
jgi:hypothetical protein